jgi:hypothetical protein
MKSVRSMTAILATATLAAGAAAPVASAQTATYPTDPSGEQRSANHGKRGKKKPRRLSDAQLTRVATALGTTLEALKAAQAAVKTATAATEIRETRAQHDALLAAELDVTVTQLRAAFASVRGTTDGKCKPRPSDSTGSYPRDRPA